MTVTFTLTYLSSFEVLLLHLLFCHYHDFLSMADSSSNQILVRDDVLSTKIFRVHAINFKGLRNKNSPG